jgi:hypothetical protein
MHCSSYSVVIIHGACDAVCSVKGFVLVIIIIIIIITLFVKGTYTYIPETNHVSREYSVAAVL